MQAKQKKQEE